MRTFIATQSKSRSKPIPHLEEKMFRNGFFKHLVFFVLQNGKYCRSFRINFPYWNFRIRDAIDSEHTMHSIRDPQTTYLCTLDIWLLS